MEINEKEKSNELKKEETLFFKGIAIIIMVGYHLFCFPERIINNEYISFFFMKFDNKTIENFIFSQGKICVSFFLFLSGYGVYISNKNKTNKIIWKLCLERIKSFLFNYWIVFFIFIPLGYIFFNLELKNILVLIKNLFLLSSSYNSEWWFAQYYVFMILLFPIINVCLNKRLKLTLIISALLCFTYKMHIAKLFIWQFPFVMGMAFAKMEIYSKLRKNIKSKKNLALVSFLGIFAIVIIKSFIAEYLNFFTDYGLDGIFIPIIIGLLLEVKIPEFVRMVLEKLGKHSGNIWLTHTFFAYYYTQKLVFYPKLSILIIIWTFILSTFSSIIIFTLSEKIIKIKNKIFGQNVS